MLHACGDGPRALHTAIPNPFSIKPRLPGLLGNAEQESISFRADGDSGYVLLLEDVLCYIASSNKR